MPVSPNDGANMYENAISWLVCALLAIVSNSWAIFSISAKQKKWKALESLLCTLAGTHILTAIVPIVMFSVINLRKSTPPYDWSEGLCKVFVSSFYTLALVTCFTVASLAYHRMWMVRWPVNYRLSNTRKQAVQAIMGIWTVSFILSTLPAVGWHDTSERFYTNNCQFLVTKIGLGFGACFLTLQGGSVAMGLSCAAITLYHTFHPGARRAVEKKALNVPTIIVEDTTGKRRSSVDGSEPLHTSLQITYLISIIVFFYNCLTGIPMLVISFMSLRQDSQAAWMVLAMIWCATTPLLMLPLSLVLSGRYRASCATIWSHCVTLLASEEAEEGVKANGGCTHDGSYCNSSHSGPAKEHSAQPHSIPESVPLRNLHSMFPEGRQFLQVMRGIPQSRRLSREEADGWPAASKRRTSIEEASVPLSSHPSPTSFKHPQSKNRESEGSTPCCSARRHSEGGCSTGRLAVLKTLSLDYGSEDTFFTLDEIISYIDETPAPSPKISPSRQPVPGDSLVSCSASQSRSCKEARRSPGRSFFTVCSSGGGASGWIRGKRSGQPLRNGDCDSLSQATEGPSEASSKAAR
uniref:probable G-protein coupled receptor 153 n=1 Tax=Myxine glutinosa TaxID=7769 RepID=UPI00358F226D